MFDAKGMFLRKFGSKGSGPGQFEAPTGIAFNAADNLLVCDSQNHRVQVLTSQGEFITTFAADMPASVHVDMPVQILVGCRGTAHVFAFLE